MAENEPSSSPAGEALRAEMADIMGNPANPLHAGYVRTEPEVMQKIQEKYAAAYGTGTVQLGEGIQTGGAEQKEVEPTTTPTLEAVRAEVADIATNPKNKMHAGYIKNDPKVEAYIDRLYKGAVGEGRVSLEGLSLQVGGSAENKGPGVEPERAALTFEDAAIFGPALTKLETEWGREFPARMAKVQSGLAAMDQKLGADADELIGAYLEADGDPVVLYKTLETIGRSRR